MAKYRGKSVKLNKVQRGGSKKFFVYVKAGSKVKKVSFGSKTMKIRKNNKAARKSFLARHRCSNAGPKTKARHWSCKMWRQFNNQPILYMRRKRHTPIFVRNCDYCGTQLQTNEPNSDSYVITAEHKIFCKIHYVGEEPIKDCLEDYIRSKNVRKIEKEKEQRRLQSNCKEQFQKEQKEKKEVRLKNLAKLEAYQKELKLKQWRQRASK